MSQSQVSLTAEALPSIYTPRSPMINDHRESRRLVRRHTNRLEVNLVLRSTVTTAPEYQRSLGGEGHEIVGTDTGGRPAVSGRTARRPPTPWRVGRGPGRYTSGGRLAGQTRCLAGSRNG